MSNKELLKDFIIEQLNEMGLTLEENHEPNMANRKNNPFNCLPDIIDKYMGLGRSFDSQLGNRLQNIAFFCARLKFGDISVPNIVFIDSKSAIVKVASIPINHKPSKQLYANAKVYNQYIRTIDVFDAQQLRNTLKYKKITKENPVSKTFSVKFPTEYKEIKKDKTPVDLLIIYENENDGKIYAYAFEIKAGGNLDTKNSVANATEVENLNNWFSFATGNENRGYFATCYQSAGGIKGGKLSDKQQMLNKDFWDFILPDDISYDTFVDIYKSAFNSSNITETIRRL